MAIITLSGTSTILTNVTDVNAATYDIGTNDSVLHVSYTGTAAVTNLKLLSSICQNGRLVFIKDSGGNAGFNNITITTEGIELIDGSATLVINSNYSSVTLYAYGSNWYII